MNKTDLINKLAEQLDGDKKVARTAVEGFIDIVQREVTKGQSVSISGFGVFEKRVRAARTARNPRTGESVKVKKTAVPAMRPGKLFKDLVAGTVKLPKAAGAPTTARATAAAAKAAPAAAKAAPVKAAPARAPRATAVKAAPAKAVPVKAAPAPRAPRATAAKAAPVAAPKATTTRAPRATAAKAAPVVKAAPKAAAAKAPAAKPAVRRTAAKAK